MLIKKVFPHVKLLISKFRNSYLKFYNQIAQIALIIQQSFLLDYVFGLFGCHLSSSIHKQLLSIQVNERIIETEKRFLKSYLHQIH